MHQRGKKVKHWGIHIRPGMHTIKEEDENDVSAEISIESHDTNESLDDVERSLQTSNQILNESQLSVVEIRKIDETDDSGEERHVSGKKNVEETRKNDEESDASDEESSETETEIG